MIAFSAVNDVYTDDERPPMQVEQRKMELQNSGDDVYTDQ